MNNLLLSPLSIFALFIIISPFQANANNNISNLNTSYKVGLNYGKSEVFSDVYKKYNFIVDYDTKHYGISFSTDTEINDNHHIYLDNSIQSTKSGKMLGEMFGNIKINKFSSKIGYKYDFNFTNYLKISPKLGIGYEYINIKSYKNMPKFLEKFYPENTHRAYYEVGLENKYNLTDYTSITLSGVYEHDLREIFRKNESFRSIGKGKSFDLLINKEIESNGHVFSIGPYYKSYNNKIVKFNNMGIKTNYNF